MPRTVVSATAPTTILAEGSVLTPRSVAAAEALLSRLLTPLGPELSSGGRPERPLFLRGEHHVQTVQTHGEQHTPDDRWRSKLAVYDRTPWQSPRSERESSHHAAPDSLAIQAKSEPPRRRRTPQRHPAADRASGTSTAWQSALPFISDACPAQHATRDGIMVVRDHTETCGSDVEPCNGTNARSTIQCARAAQLAGAHRNVRRRSSTLPSARDAHRGRRRRGLARMAPIRKSERTLRTPADSSARVSMVCGGNRWVTTRSPRWPITLRAVALKRWHRPTFRRRQRADPRAAACAC